MAKTVTGSKGSTANIGFEAKLWLAADKLRNNMDAAEYKHVPVRAKTDGRNPAGLDVATAALFPAYFQDFDIITRQTFETLDCIFPPTKLTVAFDHAVAPLLEQIRSNLRQSRTLATLRDALLPKLLSRDICAANVEEEVACV